ncbi:MAG: ribonuclease P protein component [Bacteroidales bacterium]|nr:ribonuclease P protein component [Bacteroidales bacterium]
MTSFRLYKKEKLCSLTAINLLFTPKSATADEGVNHSVMAYPWRAVWRDNGEGVCRFLISVGKKRLKHAVDRVKMRRRCREAYRLNRVLLPEGAGIDLAFIYVGKGVTDYRSTERAIQRILHRVSHQLSTSHHEPSPTHTDSSHTSLEASGTTGA